MKIAICGDVHFAKSGSLITGRDDEYSLRLQNCIKSVEWFEKVSKDNNCSMEVFLGDFFDKPALDEEVITAAKSIKWNDTPKYFLVGNHESSVKSLKYNSATLLSSEGHIVSKPTTISILNDTIDFVFIPYITEDERKPLKEYFQLNSKKKIVFSHNDIKGIQMGPVVSQEGFELEDIKNNCSLYINGHLHNGQVIDRKVVNVGILTGLNLGEDAFRYQHNIMILDTDAGTFEFVENPYAFNFYKIVIEKEEDLKQLYLLKRNAVVSVKCVEKYIPDVKQIFEDEKNTIIEKRLIAVYNNSEEVEVDTSSFTMDYLEEFKKCCHEKIDNSSILDYELAEVCK